MADNLSVFKRTCSPFGAKENMDTACGSIRGLGYSLLPTLVTLTGVCLFRIIWIMTVYRLYPTLFTLYLSYPITWIITFIAHVICFIVLYRKYRKNG